MYEAVQRYFRRANVHHVAAARDHSTQLVTGILSPKLSPIGAQAEYVTGVTLPSYIATVWPTKSHSSSPCGVLGESDPNITIDES